MGKRPAVSLQEGRVEVPGRPATATAGAETGIAGAAATGAPIKGEAGAAPAEVPAPLIVTSFRLTPAGGGIIRSLPRPLAMIAFSSNVDRPEDIPAATGERGTAATTV